MHVAPHTLSAWMKFLLILLYIIPLQICMRDLETYPRSSDNNNKNNGTQPFLDIQEKKLYG